MGEKMEAAAERLEQDVDAAQAARGDTPDEAAIVEHMRDSRPLLAWRDTPRGAEIGDGTMPLFVSVVQWPGDGWWLYFTSHDGRTVGPCDKDTAKRLALELLAEQLNAVLFELRRGVV